MKRPITDVLRRGLVSTLANWPVILLRVAETLVMFGILIASVFAVVIPLFVSAGVKHWSLPAGENPGEVALAFLGEHATLFGYLFGLTLVVFGAILAIHSFVMAGATRIFVDAERAAPDTPDPKREPFAVFTLEQFMAGAGEFWLRIFWIYNGAWGLYGLILLIPITLVCALTLMTAFAAESAVGTVIASCGGLALLTLIAIPLAFVFAVWTQKAIVVCVSRDLGVREALRSGWRESRADFLRHFIVFFLITIISVGVAALMSTFSHLSVSLRQDDLLRLITAPMQIAANVLQNAVANAVGCWLIAAFAALTEER